VARALAADPALILMDEPFGALDPITRREIQDEFRSLQKRLGKTVILVTHDLREACRLADRLALVDHGQVVQYGEPVDFIDRPSNDFVRSFFQDAGAVTPIGSEVGS
jgi:osmoprotectant transport system ATP-binding protein